jgi:hypothetical protein
MVEPNDKVFIRLISDLAEPSTLPNAWESTTDSDTLRTTALKALYRLQSTDAHKFLTVLNNDAPPNEAPVALLSRANRAAQQLLPHLIRKYQSLLEAEARETAHERFLKDESAYDPFIEDTLLTRDAFSGRGEVEPEKPVRLDRFGNCVQD